MRIRGRPVKYRIVRQDPKIAQFSPRGRIGRPDEVEMRFEEFEALRICDFLKKTQKEAASEMGVSQQTISRILRQAHGILAEALVFGKIIRIQGGDYVITADLSGPVKKLDFKGNTTEKPA